jgi:hypothetical protein
MAVTFAKLLWNANQLTKIRTINMRLPTRLKPTSEKCRKERSHSIQVKKNSIPLTQDAISIIRYTPEGKYVHVEGMYLPVFSFELED